VGQIDIAKQYFACLEASDGEGSGTLFADSAIIDDAQGGYRQGRSVIGEFIANMGEIRVAALRWLEDGPWLTCYGRVTVPGLFEDRRMRWVFHFEDDHISRLTNSWVEFLSGVESRPTNTT
jgi:SnoaL-like domain